MEDSMIDFKDYIEDVQDFPIEGITYRDIQPLLEDEEVFYDSIYELGQFVDMEEVDLAGELVLVDVHVAAAVELEELLCFLHQEVLLQENLL